METFSALLAICTGNSPVPGEFPAQRPVTRGFDVFFDLCLNKRLSKQSLGWWFETPSVSLWRHCNGYMSIFSFQVSSFGTRGDPGIHCRYIRDVAVKTPVFGSCINTNISHYAMERNYLSRLNFTILAHSANPDSKVHRDNTGPTWVLSAPDGPHAGPKNLVIRYVYIKLKLLKQTDLCYRVYFICPPRECDDCLSHMIFIMRRSIFVWIHLQYWWMNHSHTGYKPSPMNVHMVPIRIMMHIPCVKIK